MKVGDKVWLFDTNRRVYSKENKYAPIYSEHFYQQIITGETSRSWLINKDKYSKKNPIGIYTDEQKNDKIWENNNLYRIIEKVNQCSVAELKQIEVILENKLQKGQ